MVGERLAADTAVIRTLQATPLEPCDKRAAQTGNQSQLFYLFNLERRIPADHLLRWINLIVMQVLADLREKLAPFYSDIGRPSIDPELMIRMLIVGYCYGIRFERKLCEEVELF